MKVDIARENGKKGGRGKKNLLGNRIGTQLVIDGLAKHNPDVTYDKTNHNQNIIQNTDSFPAEDSPQSAGAKPRQRQQSRKAEPPSEVNTFILPVAESLSTLFKQNIASTRLGNGRANGRKGKL